MNIIQKYQLQAILKMPCTINLFKSHIFIQDLKNISYSFGKGKNPTFCFLWNIPSILLHLCDFNSLGLFFEGFIAFLYKLT